MYLHASHSQIFKEKGTLFLCQKDRNKRPFLSTSSDASGKAEKEIRTFQTLTEELRSLAAWLQTKDVTHVAMESTGVYWKPIFNVLEGEFEILVVNAEKIKKLSGRKTDVSDAEWIADLLRHGLWQRLLGGE